MKFEEKLVHGTLIKRYKRFLTDVKLDDGTEVVAHCTNSGTMKSCLENGAEVYLTPVTGPKRKTRFTWEMIKINGDWVGINTGNHNKLAFEAISSNQIPGFLQKRIVVILCPLTKNIGCGCTPDSVKLTFVTIG